MTDDGAKPLGMAFFDGAGGRWAVEPGPRQARWGHLAVALSPGDILVCSGEDFEDGQEWDDLRMQELAGSTEIFDVRASAWQPVPRVPGIARPDELIGLGDGGAMALGIAHDGDRLTAPVVSAVFDRSSRSWRGPMPLRAHRHGYSATVVGGGDVVVAGGSPSVPASLPRAAESPAVVERWDRATNAWRPAAPMGQPRIQHVAVTLATGELLVIGGHLPGGAREALSSCEIYDPQRDSWRATAPLHVPRWGHLATRLADGRVLVVTGGYVGLGCDDGRHLPELYDPASERWTLLDEPFCRRAGALAALGDGGAIYYGGRRSLGPTAMQFATDPVTGELAGMRVFDVSGPEARELAEDELRERAQVEAAGPTAWRFSGHTGGWTALPEIPWA